ncbi:hypothetical protein, partial [Escherichia coli]|uniref:hypothetical protein n=1 Tax=Escherichia coli TaxID=562 RepID=UPI001CC4B46F
HSLRLTTKWGRNPRHQGGDAKIFCAFAQKFRDMAGQVVKLTTILFIYRMNRSQGIHQKIVIKRKYYVPETSLYQQ